MRGIASSFSLLLACCLVFPLPAHAVDKSKLEAVMLFKLMDYVSFPGNPQPMALCARKDDFDGALAYIASSHARPVTLRFGVTAENARGCQLIFIQAGEKLPDSGYAALSVGDAPGFAEKGGMVELRPEGERIGLLINLPATRAAGIIISSRLLSLATVIR